MWTQSRAATSPSRRADRMIRPSVSVLCGSGCDLVRADREARHDRQPLVAAAPGASTARRRGASRGAAPASPAWFGTRSGHLAHLLQRR